MFFNFKIIELKITETSKKVYVEKLVFRLNERFKVNLKRYHYVSLYYLAMFCRNINGLKFLI